LKRLSFFRKKIKRNFFPSFFFPLRKSFHVTKKFSLSKKKSFNSFFKKKNSFLSTSLSPSSQHLTIDIASFSSWAKFYSKVTILFCRLPLLTFCSLTRGFSPKTPVADSGTTWLENYFFLQFIPVDFQGELKRDGKGWNFFGINHQNPFWGFQCGSINN